MPLRPGRRDFLKGAAAAIGTASSFASSLASSTEPGHTAPPLTAARKAELRSTTATYPRLFTGRQLKMLAFPLGGVAAGQLSLGGRGNLRDWEIFNRPNKGSSPNYAFPAIWAQAGNGKPVARVLESRLLPPYEGQDGLGSANAPGLSRLASAKFTGEYPLAHIDFEDPALPVSVSLDAFSPFIPHEHDDSGLPVAILRYTARNRKNVPARVSIAFSIDNPVTAIEKDKTHRENKYQESAGLAGLRMTNPSVESDHPMHGEFVLATVTDAQSRVSHWRGWPDSRWWNAPMLFWDAFSAHGEIGPEPDPRNAVGVIAQSAQLAPGASVSFTFLLAWHFPVRTPEWCGWDAPEGKGKTNIGNHYATRFKNAWEAAEYTARHLERLESETRLFASTFCESTLPSVVKEAASANLSTLASTTCFRTADGEFHGFEGVDDTHGCCFGNCTHVWNYETATPFLFPQFARSLRKASFGYSMDEAGAMHFRQLLPDGFQRFGFAAADGQMGQIMHAYLDWKLCGDREWLKGMWPKVKKAIEFAWVKHGWDANRDGVMEGVQHNTYDVEFYGPNPMCGIYYLGALRAAEEMARAAGAPGDAAEYRRVYESGSRWIDANLFRGGFYIQQVQGYAADQIAPNIRSTFGSENTEHPEYQVGGGCLVDQLIGQYMADISGLGSLVSPAHIRETLGSVYRYNYRPSLLEHDNVERTFALNDEAAVLICDYATAPRPRIPFPYYAEVFTGLEHAVAAMMIRAGLIDEGLECIHSTRARHDGEKRNPWDEAECGHHYARAMSSWSSVVALSGFEYDAPAARVTIAPPLPHRTFQCFWASGTGWGRFAFHPTAHGSTLLTLKVLKGSLPVAMLELAEPGAHLTMHSSGKILEHTRTVADRRSRYTLAQPFTLSVGDELSAEVHA